MSTTQHSSKQAREERVSLDHFTREFTGIPNSIFDCVFGADQAIQKLVTGRGGGFKVRLPGFVLERYSGKDDKQEGCFTLVISGHAIDVLHAQTWIFHHIRDSLQAAVKAAPGVWVGMIGKNVSWEPRGESGRLHLCMPDNWRDHFFPQPAPPPPRVLRYVAPPQDRSKSISGRYGPGNWSGVLSDAARFNTIATEGCGTAASRSRP